MTRRQEAPQEPGPLWVHAFEALSRVGGPGTRAVLWLQDGTPGRRGYETGVDEMFAHITMLGDLIEGVTVGGGEPLRQLRPVLRLLSRIREETSLSVVLLTGHGWDEVVRMPGAAALRERVDVLLAGRSERERRPGGGPRGSSERTVHLFTGRYSAADLQAVPDAEVVIRADGTFVVTGIDPPPPGG
ncbi:4Fe-4S cluster-binding domain-containing protein [Actinomadura graeca]|uniref:4Fe-4S cluster-binding domain-containing protein n=1 Tax=Actinomadura graeca TaxID=2750812 RepID=A0ABX8QUI3_9ACTN|nr:4Fe-4S cluster-binding domain-containing protein [Actinomadura graeca]QXJ22293.1 4Fe-4S cluster-binding domain-containing protein [Actinomadura graeca]